MGLRNSEKETVILINNGEKKALISTSQDWMKERFRKMAMEDPENVIITGEDQYTMLVEVPKNYVRIRIPRKMSDEQKAANAERLSKFWRQKKNTV